MVRCKISNKSAGESSQSVAPNSQGNASNRVSSAVSAEAPASELISSILRNPVGFIFNPKAGTGFYQDADFAEAHAFFTAQEQDRFVYSVCSVLFHSRHPSLNSALLASGMSEFPKSRFWPFWHAGELSDSEAKSADSIQDYLFGLWNDPEKKSGMFYQTGYLELAKRARIGTFHFFKCVLPIRRSGARKPDSITFAFDPESRGFYTINARVRSEEPEHRFKYVEFIRPDLLPPNLSKFVTKAAPKHWKVLLVLDRHIGDNLSLFTTHIPYLSKIEQFDLTLDASMCPFFDKATPEILGRFLPGTSVNLLETPPAHKADFDLVFDPYDWVSEMFELKPQNDSGAAGVVSGIEYARCCLHNKRRDILDMHMSALKGIGIISRTEPNPEFVRYRVTSEERVLIRRKTRAKLLQNSRRKESAKIVSFYPFGLSDNRRYPVQALQTVIHALLRDPDLYVIIAGTSYDTPELAATIRSDWEGLSHPCRHRIKLFSDEPLSGLIDLMLASDAVVSMDSGPLHLARSLRLNPIGLYTAKVNDPSQLLLFPWFVEDGTVEVLKPDPGQAHVFPYQLVSSIERRINFRPIS